MAYPAFLRLIVVVMALIAGPMAAQDRLDGRYTGVEAAAGATLDIAPDAEGFRGTYRDATGKAQDFVADREGESALAVLDLDGGTVLMRVTPLPYGVEVALVPITQAGAVQLDQTRTESFLREGLSLPQVSPDFVAAPSDGNGRITGWSFLASYEFWDPEGVRNGYLSLAPRMQTLFRLFPAVQLDVIWKLCLARDAEAALGIALRGAQVGCAEVIEGIAESQRSLRFGAYKAAVAEDLVVLRRAVRCADRYPEPKEVCDESARAVAAAAISLRTAGSVLAGVR